MHPQFWPENLDYTDKKVVIIGSGATAVTILPAMADKVKHITMLQRSPSYFLMAPLIEPIDNTIKAWLPEALAYRLIRFRFCSWLLVLSILSLVPKEGYLGASFSDREGVAGPYPVRPAFCAQL